MQQGNGALWRTEVVRLCNSHQNLRRHQQLATFELRGPEPLGSRPQMNSSTSLLFSNPFDFLHEIGDKSTISGAPHIQLVEGACFVSAKHTLQKFTTWQKASALQPVGRHDFAVSRTYS